LENVVPGLENVVPGFAGVIQEFSGGKYKAWNIVSVKKESVPGK
jgi:hypothetical protein